LHPVFCVAAGLVLFGCTKENAAPDNPFGPEVIVEDPDTTTPQIPDPYSITGLHKNIFSAKCSMPGCHDGNFEPDFRTIQSSYSTLVYQTVNKTVLPDSLRFYLPCNSSIQILFRMSVTTPQINICLQVRTG
jgi:hypothetical protein